MSQKERDRLKIVEAVEKKRLGAQDGADQLGMSARGLRKLRNRYRTSGDSAVIHGLRGRDSNRRISEKIKLKTIRLIQKKYSDFGPTLAAEYLVDDAEISISRETLRGWMIQEGLWKSRPARKREIHVWRERRASEGELIQWDTSIHDWLEGRGEKLVLIAMIDDATSKLYGEFHDSDTTINNMIVLGNYLKLKGRPIAAYTDKNSIFKVNRGASIEEQLDNMCPDTQLGRALKELDIEWIAAHSPQAKGRIERSFGTMQDRLIKAMRIAGIKDRENANAYLHTKFIPFWDERFGKSPRTSGDAHRLLTKEHRLDEILSIRERRKVRNDYTIQWQNNLWQIAREEIRHGLLRVGVDIEQRLNGAIHARFQGKYLKLQRIEAAKAAARGLPDASVALRAPSASGKPAEKTKYIPPSDHPWRRTFLPCRKAELSTLR